MNQLFHIYAEVLRIATLQPRLQHLSDRPSQARIECRVPADDPAATGRLGPRRGR